MQSLHVTTRTPQQQITAVLDLYDRKALGQIVIDGESRGGGRTLNNDFWDSLSTFTFVVYYLVQFWITLVQHLACIVLHGYQCC